MRATYPSPTLGFPVVVRGKALTTVRNHAGARPVQVLRSNQRKVGGCGAIGASSSLVGEGGTVSTVH